ncbi:MAG: hypothetical protein ABIK45_05215 [Pseudomonadota bacterium]
MSDKQQCNRHPELAAFIAGLDWDQRQHLNKMDDWVERYLYIGGLLKEEWFSGPISWDLSSTPEEIWANFNSPQFALMLMRMHEEGHPVFKLRKRLNSEAEKLLSGWKPISLETSKKIDDTLSQAFTNCGAEYEQGKIDIHNAFNEAAQTICLLPLALLDEGWYLLFRNERMFCCFAYLFDSRLAPYIDIVLTKEVEKRFADLIDEYMELYPHRKGIFIRMKENYENERFEEFILSAFAQIDGCANEDFGCSPFTKDKDIPKIVKKINKVFKEHDQALLSQFLLLYHVSSLFKCYKQNKGNLSYPSRHGVMHGLQLNYGTRTNCMKVMSFAGYMIECIKMARSKKFR